MAKKNSGKKTKSTIKLSESLALSRWVLSLFGVDTLEDLSLHLKDETLEGRSTKTTYIACITR